jgi:hypothetical protein
MHKQVTVFEPAKSIDPALQAEISDLWATEELGNDYHYYPWRSSLAYLYPNIDAYIRANKLEGRVLLHYSW